MVKPTRYSSDPLTAVPGPEGVRYRCPYCWWIGPLRAFHQKEIEEAVQSVTLKTYLCPSCDATNAIQGGDSK